MRKLPLVIMLLVLVAPFAVSLMLLDNKSNLVDKARGNWLDKTHYVNTLDNNNWQILWREQDCITQCDQWHNLLMRVKVALGKNQTKVDVEKISLGELLDYDKGLFIANDRGLVLLAYEANESGAYNLLKDLKVLIKHNGK